MDTLKKLPIDYETWKKMGYDPMYFAVDSPFEQVANSTIKFYEHRLEQLDKVLTEENKKIFKDEIARIKRLIK